MTVCRVPRSQRAQSVFDPSRSRSSIPRLPPARAPSRGEGTKRGAFDLGSHLERSLASVPDGTRALLGSPAAGLTLRLTNLGLQLLASSPAAHPRIVAEEVGATLAGEACESFGLKGPKGVGVAVEMAFGVAFGMAIGGLDVDAPKAFGLALLGAFVGRHLGRWGQEAATALGLPPDEAGTEARAKRARGSVSSSPRSDTSGGARERGAPASREPERVLPDVTALLLTLTMIGLRSGRR